MSASAPSPSPAAAAHPALATVHRLLQQARDEEETSAKAQAHIANAQTAGQTDAQAAAAPTVTCDTMRVAASVLLLQMAQAIQQQQALAQAQAQAQAETNPSAASSSSSAAAAAAVSTAAPSAVPSSSPLYSSLPDVASQLPLAFFVRLLSSGCGPDAPRLPVGSLPPLKGGQQVGVSYPELALRLLRVLASHPDVARSWLQSNEMTSSSEPPQPSLLVELLGWLRLTAQDAAARTDALQLVLPVLEQFAVSCGAGDAPSIDTIPVTLVQLQPLTSLLPSLLTLDAPIAASCARVLAWLLPASLIAAPAAQRVIAARHLIPTLAVPFERVTGLLKLDCLRMLVALHEAVANTHHEAEGRMVPLPAPLQSLRTGLETLLGSKLDLPHRLRVVQLSRMLLQRHGPLFASSPAAASAVPSSPATPHVRFLQLLYNISTVELRMALMERASKRAADMARLTGTEGRLRQQMLLEALSLASFLMSALVGEDEEVEARSRSYQWWNLPILMLFKQKLDESGEALLTFFHELQAAPSHPRAPSILFTCARVLAQWLSEDSDMCERAEVLQILPFLLSLEDPATPPSEPESVLAVLLPALLFLCSIPDAVPVLRAHRVPVRLAEEVIAREFDRDVKSPWEALRVTGEMGAASEAAEVQEMRAALQEQMRTGVATIGNAAHVIAQLCQGEGRRAAFEQLVPVLDKLRVLLNQLLEIASDPLVHDPCEVEGPMAEVQGLIDSINKLDKRTTAA